MYTTEIPGNLAEGETVQESRTPTRPFTYVLSLPSDGVECFFIEGGEGAPEVGCVYGPQSPDNEATARLWCQSPRLLQDLILALGVFQVLADEGKSGTARELATRFEATIAAAVGGAEC